MLPNPLSKRIFMALLAICFTFPAFAQKVSYYNCLGFYKEGDVVKAIECLSDVIEKNPKDPSALSVRAYCYANLGAYARAFTDINNAIKYHNKKSDFTKDMLYAERAKYYMLVENYNAALKDYSTAIKINSKNTDALFERANLYFRLENYSASDADWKQVLKIEKESVNAQVGIARNMIAKKDVENAIKELDRLEKIDSKNPNIFRYRSEGYAQKENYKKAIDDLITWCYYDNIDAYKKTLFIEYAKHEFTYALAKITERVVKDIDNKINWLDLRITFYEEYEMYQEAIEDYNAIEALLSSPNISIYYGRGECFSETGEYDKAINEFDKGIALQENEYLYMSRARAKRLKADYRSAIEDLSKAIELDPMNNFAYYMRGWIKEFDKDFQGALKDYNTSVELDKEYAYIYETRGRLYKLHLNEPQLAEKDFEKVLSLEKEIKKMGNCRQYALFFLGRIEEAIVIQDSLLQKYPTSSNYYNATCLYALMNRLEDALKYLHISFEKGYRDFIHIENDTDLDSIRNASEFIELIEEWKNKVADKSSTTGQIMIDETQETQRYVVKTKELKSGVYELPCTVNDLPLTFIFDTGASDITISSLEAAFMLKNNYLNEYDFKERRNYRTASGDIVEGTKIRLRKIKIGDLELNNIEASVVDRQSAPLLFGQSALGKFVKITIDNKNSEIIFER